MSMPGFALLIALVGPLLTVILLRMLRTRMTVIPFYSIASLLFACSAAAVIWLVQRDIPTVSVGSLAIVQPLGIDVEHPEGTDHIDVPIEPVPSVSPVATLAPTTKPTPTRSPTRQPTPTRQVTATSTPTEEPTATLEPTLEPTAEPTEEPASQQTYTVKPGDTLRSIAALFGVSVEALMDANDLTAAEADALQPGDTLLIP